MEWRRLPKRLLVLCCLAAALVATARSEVRHFHATDGNYRVTITFGDAQASTDTSVKAELGRLMLESVRTDPGQTVRRSFLVNVRGPQIAGGGEVRLKEREKTSERAGWDDQLTLEFVGPRPGIQAVEIEPAPEAPTLFIAGDSTVADQSLEPYASWGQMITRFFGPGMAVANHSESGESSTSFIAENRLAKLKSLMKPGDFLLVQMGHNDQKLTANGAGPWTSYTAQLKQFVAAARDRGATPILVTPVQRRTFEAEGKIANSLGDFPAAVRRVARDSDVPLIDLHAMSKIFYEALGPEKSLLAFAPNDGTHHNAYGAYELARCVVESIRAQKLPLAKYLGADIVPFDPARPDPVEAFRVPPSQPESAAQVKSRRAGVVLIGDSTVHNGRGDGRNGQWGWGEPLAEMLAPIPILNRAVGGRSSRTFLSGGNWDAALAVLQPGDILLIQFGHNDGGPLDDKDRARGSLPGIGDETRDIDNPLTGRRETVHTYGYYLRRYIQEAKARGATPVICSPIPRNVWKDGRVARSRYAQWAAEVARSEGVAFLDLESRITTIYESRSPEDVNALFEGDHTHTSRAGAELNAQVVAQWLREQFETLR